MQTNEASIETTKPRRDGRGVSKNIPIESLVELKRKDLTDEQIASILGCERSNVTKRLAKYKDQLEGLDRFKKNRGDVLAFNQMRLVSSITDRDIKSASLLQRTTAFGILYDKERLERGMSTENVSIKSITLNISKEMEEISKARQALQAQLDE